MERIEGSPPWARVAFRRSPSGDWVPSAPRARDLDAVAAASDSLPRTIMWQACRDTRTLGTVTSKRRHGRFFADLATQDLIRPLSMLDKLHYDPRFEMFDGSRAIQPVVISTLPNVCRTAGAVQQAPPSLVERLVTRELQNVSDARLRTTQVWKVGSWTIIEVEYEIPQNLAMRERVLGHLTDEQLRRAKLRRADLPNLFQGGTEGSIVVFAIGEDTRLRVASAHIVDWVSVDGDDTPDVVLRSTGYNKDGYVLVYGGFTKQAAFEWAYH